MTPPAAPAHPAPAHRPGATPVCAAADLVVGRGVAALVEGRAVALFRLDPALVGPADHGIRAVANVEPRTGASVLSRGLVGATTRRGALVHYVASPLRKERFDLDSGAEVDGPARLDRWEVTVVDGVVLVTPDAGSQGVNDRDTIRSQTG